MLTDSAFICRYLFIDISREQMREEATQRICLARVFRSYWAIATLITKSHQHRLWPLEFKPVLQREKKKSLQLAGAKYAGLTTKCWTAFTMESFYYVTITCHYVHEDWLVKLAVLLTQSMPGRHTADNLTPKLTDAVELWGLTGKVAACVHDNARNIVAANSPRRVNWDSVACFAVNDGFNRFVHRVFIEAVWLFPTTAPLHARHWRTN